MSSQIKATKPARIFSRRPHNRAALLKLFSILLLTIPIATTHAQSTRQTVPVSPGQSQLRSAATIAIKTVPSTQPAPNLTADGVQSIYFEGPAYHHKPTRVFAWYGFPANFKPGDKVPAMVLVHGGGGTAFTEWVRLWNQKGYAAIAMDTCGCIPIGSNNHWQRDPQGGPPGWGGFDQLTDPPTDQWTYHAALDVILAHSLIRSWPQVDADHIGLTGISWGGYLTCIVAGLDNRFQFACPVYGCGFLGDNSAWLDDFKAMGSIRSTRWLNDWDPSHYLPNAKMPMLWIDGTNDAFYPPDSLQKSFSLPTGPQTLCIRVNMPHGHQAGWAPPEIAAFADTTLKAAPDSLTHIDSLQLIGPTLQASYNSPSNITQADLNYTTDTGPWKTRHWQTVPVDQLTPTLAKTNPPANATAFYLNLTNEKGLITSSNLTIK